MVMPLPFLTKINAFYSITYKMNIVTILSNLSIMGGIIKE